MIEVGVFGMNEEMKRDGIETEPIYEPLKAYKSVYKDLHHQNVTEFFDGLVDKSQIDVELNRQTVKKINQKTKKHEQIVRKIRKQNTFRLLLIVLILIMIGVIFVSGQMVFQNGDYGWPLVAFIIGIIAMPLSIVSIVKMKPQLEHLKIERGRVEEELSDLKDEAWRQMQPLNELFTEDMNKSLFNMTLPLINLDKMFDSKRLEYLVRKFGLDGKPDPNRSTLYVQSGDINGNPFFLANDLVHELGMKTYTGSITIHWTSRRTVNGKRVTQHHSQVLTASIDRPYPYYDKQTYLVYGNEAAPDLIFSRQDSDAEHMTQKEIDRHVKRKMRTLRRKSRKNVSKGGSYTVLGNSEFEVLFGATNRNNEVQFRLLFTPLAQKQLLELMKDKEVGFGDDFDFIKHKKINVIIPEHLRRINLNPSVQFFKGYDYDQVREKFISYNNAYFKHVYFTFAPVLAIPLYQQHQPHEYIYEGLYDSYVSFYEHEYIANNMNLNKLKHPLSVTPNILKTSVINSENNCDRIKVIAHGYRTVNRVEYVTRWGRDGRPHRIPIHWTEYIPVEKETEVAVHVMDEEEKKETYNDKVRAFIEKLRHREGINEKDVFYMGTYLAYIVKESSNK